jgi:hypothetical protein
MSDTTSPIVVTQVLERWRISFPKWSVTEVGREEDGPVWTGTVTRIRQFTRKVLGGELIEFFLADVEMANRPGQTYQDLRVLFRASEAVNVHFNSSLYHPQRWEEP